eukprot:TRINITY_DN2684_c0_g1_i10.p1 TRINITY_DN2684_c0_g1~~TRINITY_DN2684_c0_g1_i10.p1  ORF type:complete len:295 (+),score=38.56 TRINITY_DN2684_c0_g1_i10:35-919(+)
MALAVRSSCRPFPSVKYLVTGKPPAFCRQPILLYFSTIHLHLPYSNFLLREKSLNAEPILFGGPSYRKDLALFSTSRTSSSGPEAMEKQFEEFRQQLEDSGNIREKLRTIVSDIESVTRVMQAELLQSHYTSFPHDIVDMVKGHIGKLKELYAELAEVIKGAPGQYYRYHDHWRYQTQIAVYLIVFLHWLETGNLLSYSETQGVLGLNPEEFGLDIDDYLIGVCNMSNELPRYVVNQVTIGDYECPKRVSKFLSDLYAAFRILNLRNDLLRKKFDVIKHAEEGSSMATLYTTRS